MISLTSILNDEDLLKTTEHDVIDVAEMLNSSKFSVNLNDYKIKVSMGTKMDTLVRLLKHIDDNSPNSKTLIFSQWDSILDAVAHTLRMNDVPAVRFEVSRKGSNNFKKFINDLDVRVIMLHAKSQSRSAFPF